MFEFKTLSTTVKVYANIYTYRTYLNFSLLILEEGARSELFDGVLRCQSKDFQKHKLVKMLLVYIKCGYLKFNIVRITLMISSILTHTLSLVSCH